LLSLLLLLLLLLLSSLLSNKLTIQSPWHSDQHQPSDQPRTHDLVYEELRLRLSLTIHNMEGDKELAVVLRGLVAGMTEVDGLASWREREAAELTRTVQSSLASLQDTQSCDRAKKLVCHLSYAKCGYGCLIHHLTYCLISAHATGRVLVISSQPWYYSDMVIKTLLTPLSSTCTRYTGPTKKVWEVDPSDSTPTLEIPPYSFRKVQFNNQPYLPPAMHTTLAERVYRLVGEPDAWWVGQYVGYILRYNQTVREQLQLYQENIDYSTPIVGIHVRRTDKIGTFGGGFAISQVHELEEYMEKVEMWFRKYEMTHGNTKRQIYIATDEPKVLIECHKKYPEYTIYDNLNIAKSAAKRLRDSEESLLGVIQDIHMLATTNYVVCTHTSNICRLVYELLHYQHGDASTMLHSLDIPWGFQFVRKKVHFKTVVEQPRLSLSREEEVVSVNEQGNYYTRVGNTSLVRGRSRRTGGKQFYRPYTLRQIPSLYNFTHF